MNNKKIKILKDGPYLVSGSLPLETDIEVLGSDGEPEKWQKGESYPLQDNYALCRCGHSANKPFCDGTHAKLGFDGKETAKKRNYLEIAEKNPGPGVDLLDAECFCSIARFCHHAGDAWTLTENSADAVAKQIAIEEACNCPSGRLVALDKKSNEPIEPTLEPSLGLIEDTRHKVSGPLWVKGGIPIGSADGSAYEIRDRVTLCRCGASTNKPFCNGAHIKNKFHDGYEFSDMEAGSL